MRSSVYPYEEYLYISSHFFLIPVFLSIYIERYDILWISTSILATSIIRWGNPDELIYQYIDHNWVKILFLCTIVAGINIIVETNTNELFIIWYFGCLLSILFYWLVEWIFMLIKREVIIPLHMYVHFYTIILMFVLFNIDYNINNSLIKIKNIIFTNRTIFIK